MPPKPPSPQPTPRPQPRPQPSPRPQPIPRQNPPDTIRDNGGNMIDPNHPPIRRP